MPTMGTLFLLTRDVAVLWLASVWAAGAVFVARDAQRRLGPRAALAATAAALSLPLVGALLWLCARPSESLEERRARRLRRRLLEEAASAGRRCLLCCTPLDDQFACCPGCGVELSRTCGGCGARLRATWHACPWCAAPAEPDRAPLAA
jgi:hypothetical protein